MLKSKNQGQKWEMIIARHFWDKGKITWYKIAVERLKRIGRLDEQNLKLKEALQQIWGIDGPSAAVSIAGEALGYKNV